MTDLRSLWTAAHEAKAAAEVASAEADAAAAAYNLALVRAVRAAKLPPGWTFDVHGDGAPKAAAACKPPAYVPACP